MNTRNEKLEIRRTPVTGAILPNSVIAELVYDPTEKRTTFEVSDGVSVESRAEIPVGIGEMYVPTSPQNNLIRHNVVSLPSGAEEYGSTEGLVCDIEAYIHRYVDLSPAFETVAAHYVLLSWVYEAFNELPYLRFRGDYGSGKTRALLILGSICYKGIFASGASTVSPIFHILDSFRGTLVFDEADFRFSDEKAELSKILNNGNVRGFPVLRTTINIRKEFDPRAFQVFGPKLVAMRGNYDDHALESRFLTEDMGTWGLRSDIPISLPEVQKEEALALRNKLLMYRFRNLTKAHELRGQLNGVSESRLKQVLAPLASVLTSDKAREALLELAKMAERGIRTDRSETAEAHIFLVLVDLFRDSGTDVVSVSAVADRFRSRYASEYQRPITNRWVGSLLRRQLCLKAYKSHGVYVVPWMGAERFAELSRRYGDDVVAKPPTEESG